MTEIRVYKTNSIKCEPIESRIDTERGDHWMRMIVNYKDNREFEITFFADKLKNLMFEDNIPPNEEIIEQFERVTEQQRAKNG